MTLFQLFVSKKMGGSGGGSSPVLVSKTINQNGYYNPFNDNADGYSSVTVTIPDGDQIAY